MLSSLSAVVGLLLCCHCGHGVLWSLWSTVLWSQESAPLDIGPLPASRPLTTAPRLPMHFLQTRLTHSRTPWHHACLPRMSVRHTHTSSSTHPAVCMRMRMHIQASVHPCTHAGTHAPIHTPCARSPASLLKLYPPRNNPHTLERRQSRPRPTNLHPMPRGWVHIAIPIDNCL